MQLRIWFTGLCLGVVGSVFAADANDIAACYKKAEGKGDLTVCLKAENKLVQKDYDLVMEQLMTLARTLDRGTKKNTAVESLKKANKGFEQYVKNQCEWMAMATQSGEGVINEMLSCQINLYRRRQTDLEMQLLRQGRN